ncbi:MAG: hypothetical protein BMS9Abin34_522 [Patescibacteria group bacterium]|nr:MAG: hypothetical protein BMS9Abin34_522 [Patescibacteria group bacterium]
MCNPLGTKLKRSLLAAAILVLAVGFPLLLFRDTFKYRSLVLDIPAEEVFPEIYFGPLLNQEELDSITPGEKKTDLLPQKPLPLEELRAVLAVSTGEVSTFVIKSGYTGEAMGDATALKVATKDSKGRVETLNLVLQIVPSGDSQPLIPQFAGLAGTAESPALSAEQIAKLFPKGSKWVFSPLLDFRPPVLSDPKYQDYLFLARKYYQDDLKGINEYMDSGLKKSYKGPVLLVDLAPGELE